MKFIEASPDIPNELIHEVNDGEAVFLCGAGVSRGANLPLFQELTDKVYEKIGESFDNEPAERIAYKRAEYDRVLRSLEKRTLLPGTDSRVREAVAEILAPPSAPDLSRHISLLTLSRDKNGRPRLLTTNFDTLFERAAGQDGIECRSHAGKSLPRPGILRTARLKMDRDEAKVKACLDKIYFGDVHDDIDRILRAHTPTAQSNREFALNAQPLKVSISRINRA
ncbi:hypothetical protein [Bradyrhizobium uaiense]|uniref:Uncharacterized protein n=1 Tax=Bradyrhizobium uaiense TaxID=2594946 RepID=A0A6P1BNH6_9BRAD|nr:hypothetical protein [Bradyrhizobium uaiense]NEU99190.1 hypothetical protein [Bradyrhizobium uaiense]